MKRVSVFVATQTGTYQFQAYESATPGLVVGRAVVGRTMRRVWNVIHAASGRAAVVWLPRRSCALAVAKSLGETGVDWTVDAKRLKRQLRGKDVLGVVSRHPCWQRTCGGRHD